MSSAYILNFRRFPQEIPKDGQDILYIESSPFYSTYEFHFGKFDVQWEDDNGGVYFDLVEGQETEGLTKLHCIGSTVYYDNAVFLWVPAEEVDSMLTRADT